MDPSEYGIQEIILASPLKGARQKCHCFGLMDTGSITAGDYTVEWKFMCGFTHAGL